MPTMEKEPLVALGSVWHRPPLALSRAEAQRLPAGHGVCYQIAREAQRKILEHARSNPQNEVGGLLVGETYQWKNRFLVRIVDALAAKHTNAGPISVCFTGTTWWDLIAARQALNGRHTVGWYHSHPGIGVFLSQSDLFVHRSFFGDQPWYLALVIDPIALEQGVFAREAGAVVSIPEYPSSL